MRIQASAGPIALAFTGILLGTASADVARLSVIASGSVSVTRAGERTPTAASVNWPLVAGDTVAADSGARAEIQLDGFTDVRLNGGTNLTIVANDARTRRIALKSGVIELAMLRGSDAPAEVSTPAFTMRTRYAGDYRVSLRPDGTAAVTPRSGQADVVTKDETVTVLAGNTIAVRGTGDAVSTQTKSAEPRDAFDAFNAQRDRTLLAALDDDAHIPASIAGYDDLNAYGTWTKLASYGAVWVPNDQSAGWAPYRDGAWSYIGNDGWTWIGSEPWGWIPYHYGRWLYSSGYNWCWYPPPVGFNPVWAPALVGFFGGDTGDFSNVGWVPLAPFEPYTPWTPPHHYYPPPAPPPPHHHGGHLRMTPQPQQYRNARFGGATTIGATTAHGLPLPHSALPVTRAVPEFPAAATVPTKPALASTPVLPVIRSLPGVVPATQVSLPVVHDPAPAHSTHANPPHPPA